MGRQTSRNKEQGIKQGGTRQVGGARGGQGQRRQKPTSQPESRNLGGGTGKVGRHRNRKKKLELSLAARSERLKPEHANRFIASWQRGGKDEGRRAVRAGQGRGMSGGRRGVGMEGQRGEGQGQGVGRARSCIWQDIVLKLRVPTARTDSSNVTCLLP